MFLTLTELLNAGYFAAFVIGLFLVVATLGGRVIEYRRAKWEQPFLLRREIVLFGSWGVSFLLISAARVLGWGPVVAGQAWWTVTTGTPAVAGLWYWLYVEHFKLRSQKKKTK